MRIPAAREHVHIDGQEGEFLVIWVDCESETAQVVTLLEGYEVLSVPFGQVRALREDGSQLGTITQT